MVDEKKNPKKERLESSFFSDRYLFQMLMV